MGVRYREYMATRRRSGRSIKGFDEGAMNASLTKEIEGLLHTLNKLPSYLDKHRRKVLEYAAKPLVQAAQANAPVSKKVHYIYNTAKFDKSKRAKKGSGQKRAIYPGNLRDSIMVLKHGKFRRSKDVFVGPKISNSKKSSLGGGRKTVSGYYAHWVEFGNRHIRNRQPFMRPAVAQSQAAVKQRLTLAIKRIMNAFAYQNKK